MASLILAIRFLTIVPVPGSEARGSGALGRSAPWFPVVGLGLGAILALADAGLGRLFPPLVASALVLALWKALTGGIHLDGLADCLDGLAGRDPEQRRAIMKDSSVGVFGAIGLVLVLLLGWVALAEVPVSVRSHTLVLTPLVGRLMPLAIGRWYRGRTVPGSLGAEFASEVSPASSVSWTVVIVVFALLLLGILGVMLCLVALVAVTAWSRLLVARIDGLTGDVLGSGVEIGEVAGLLTAVSLTYLRAP